jgi:very-short-patch-repair endonuclease
MRYSEIKAIASRLRKEATPSEKLLWERLRRKQLNGRRFLRQHPIIYQRAGNDYEFYVPDFYCAAEKLVVELDGKIHLKTKEHDEFRDSILKHFGLRVLRIKNEELGDMDNVLNKIKSYFND